MVSNNMSGIEKLQEYAFGMKPRRCDDILVLAGQIEREHVAELQALEERYKTDLREARDFRRNIAIMLGISCDGIADDVYDAIKAELDKRLMPPGMEWPRFEDGKKITWDDAPEDIAAVCLALDGSCYSLHYDMPDDECMCIYDVRRRVKRHVTEVLGADGLPINVGETVYSGNGNCYVVVEVDTDRALVEFDGEPKRGWRASFITHTPPDTQESIDEDAKLDPCEYSCWRKLCAHGEDCHGDYYDEAQTAMIDDLLCRQRELDARTMGGDAS